MIAEHEQSGTLMNGLESVGNDGEEIIEFARPYWAEVTIVGTTPILFHRWSCESVEAKATAAKGSKAKKTDDVKSYVWRCDNGNIGIPGEYLRQSIITAAKFRQDPRSPRKSAKDLFTAAIIADTDIAEIKLGDHPLKQWSYLDQRRVVVQRNAITRQRPAVEKGWSAVFKFIVLLPQYVPSDVLHEVITQAGMLIGLADFRPSYGRFRVTKFERLGEVVAE